MIGWWEERALVRVHGAGAEHVRATLFVGGGGEGGPTQTAPTFAISIASWAPTAVSVSLSFDWATLGALGLVTPPSGTHRMQLRSRAIDGFQPERSWKATAPIALRAKGSGYEGFLLELVTDTSGP